MTAVDGDGERSQSNTGGRDLGHHLPVVLRGEEAPGAGGGGGEGQVRRAGGVAPFLPEPGRAAGGREQDGALQGQVWGRAADADDPGPGGRGVCGAGVQVLDGGVDGEHPGQPSVAVAGRAAGQQSLQKQNALVEELFLDFFTREKYIGDRQVLLAAAEKVGVQDGEALLAGETGLKEVLAEERSFRRGVSGVPHFVIDGRYQVSGAQPPEAFVEALELAAKNQKPEANGAPTAACTRDGCQ